MKNLLLFLCLSTFLSIQAFAQDGHKDWLTNFEEAKTNAASKGKFILMSFSGSDWCANCMRLDKDLFQNEAFKSYANENLVLLNLDFPAKKKNKLPEELTKQNEMLFEKYNKSNAFPAVVIVDAEGNMVGKMKYPLSDAKSYLANIQSLVSK